MNLRRPIINAKSAHPPADATPDQTFAEWLATEMPAGTIIGDPAWWADRIARQHAKRCAPPSAPVGVEAVFNLVRACDSDLHAMQRRAERLAEAGRRVTAAFRAHGEASPFTRQAERTRHECEAAMLSLADALRDHEQEVE